MTKRRKAPKSSTDEKMPQRRPPHMGTRADNTAVLNAPQQKQGPYPTIQIQTGDIRRRAGWRIQHRFTGLGCMVKIPKCGSRKRWKSARPQRSRQLNRIRSAAQATATIALLLQSLNSAHTFTSTRKYHAALTPIGPGSDTEVRFANVISDILKRGGASWEASHAAGRDP